MAPVGANRARIIGDMKNTEDMARMAAKEGLSSTAANLTGIAQRKRSALKKTDPNAAPSAFSKPNTNKNQFAPTDVQALRSQKPVQVNPRGRGETTSGSGG
jgi:hypothetical protein